jgi:hypothetical protein
VRYSCLSLAIDKCRLFICCWIFFKEFFYEYESFFIAFVWQYIIYCILNSNIMFTLYSNTMFLLYSNTKFPLYSNTTPLFYSKTMSRVLEQTLHFYILNPLLPWQWLWDNNLSSFLQAYPSKYLVEHERVKSYISLNMRGLKITNDVLWWILC